MNDQKSVIELFAYTASSSQREALPKQKNRKEMASSSINSDTRKYLSLIACSIMSNWLFFIEYVRQSSRLQDYRFPECQIGLAE